jgi:hypothetical protein
MDLIKQQLERNALNFRECEHLIDAIMRVIITIHDRLRSQDHKLETQTKWHAFKTTRFGALHTSTHTQNSGTHIQAQCLCDALELVMDRVYTIRVDAANLKLRNIAPVIRDHGIQYERTHFEKKLAAGAITLQHTQQWVKYTVDKLMRINDPKVGVANLRIGKDYQGVLHTAMIDLVVEFPHWGGTPRGLDRQEEIPETLLLDSLRVKALNAHFHTDVMCAVMLVTVDHETRRCIPDAATRTQVCSHISALVFSKPPKPHDPTDAISMIVSELTPHIGMHNASVVRSMLEKHVQKSNLVYLHMVKSFKNHWFDMLKKSALTPGCPVNADVIRLPGIASRVVKETGKHALDLSLIVMLNRKVHCKYYDAMIAQAVKDAS